MRGGAAGRGRGGGSRGCSLLRMEERSEQITNKIASP